VEAVGTDIMKGSIISFHVSNVAEEAIGGQEVAEHG